MKSRGNEWASSERRVVWGGECHPAGRVRAATLTSRPVTSIRPSTFDIVPATDGLSLVRLAAPHAGHDSPGQKIATSPDAPKPIRVRQAADPGRWWQCQRKKLQLERGRIRTRPRRSMTAEGRRDLPSVGPMLLRPTRTRPSRGANITIVPVLGPQLHVGLAREEAHASRKNRCSVRHTRRGKAYVVLATDLKIRPTVMRPHLELHLIFALGGHGSVQPPSSCVSGRS